MLGINYGGRLVKEDVAPSHLLTLRFHIGFLAREIPFQGCLKDTFKASLKGFSHSSFLNPSYPSLHG